MEHREVSAQLSLLLNHHTQRGMCEIDSGLLLKESHPVLRISFAQQYPHPLPYLPKIGLRIIKVPLDLPKQELRLLKWDGGGLVRE